MIGIAGVIGMLLAGRAKDPFAALSDLSVGDYRDNANSLRGNTYKLRGSIDERIDEWATEEGRLFKLLVGEGSSSEPVVVFFPPDLNTHNIQRDQEYLMKVEVGEKGVLVVIDLQKT